MWQFASSKTFLSAVELGVFTELAKGPLDCERLRDRLKLDLRGARDFFDALVAMGMLKRKGGTYSNTPMSDFYLDRAKQSYAGGIAEMAGLRLYRFWGDLSEALRTGKPQNELKGATGGGNIFDAIYSDPKLLRGFLTAMTGNSLPVGKAIAAKFPWRKYKSFADIGAAQGALPVQVALRHKHLEGGGYDLPPVGPIFNEYVASFGLQKRLRFYPGDFMKDSLPHAEVLVMGHILHDWNLDEKRMLLKKAFDALPKDGALIVYEHLIDDDRRKNLPGLLMSLNMLVETPGGFDFTGADCREWMREAGFRKTGVVHLLGPQSMVVGIK
jgi:O-methyltransferase/methyltransferase family protein